MGERLAVESLKFLQRCIGIGVWLEISQIATCPAIAALVELYSLFQLLRNALVGGTVVGMKGVVIAERTSSASFAAVAVGTSETGVHHKFLQPDAVFLFEVICL